MAKLEWRQVQGVPGNPVDGFRTFMEGVRGAEAAARGIRDNQIKNHQVGMQALGQIMEGTTSVRDQDLEELKLSATAAGPELFNRQELGSAAREHFFAGGNIDDFQFGGFDPTNKDQYSFAKGVFKESEDRLEKAMTTASEQLEANRLAEINSVKNLAQEGTPEYEREVIRIEQEYEVKRQNLGATVFEQQLGHFKNMGKVLGLNGSTPNTSQVSDSAVSVIENRATGSAPTRTAQTPTGPRVAHHAQSRIAERDAEANTQASVRDESIAVIEEALAAGQITEEDAAVQIDIANKQYDAVMQAYDDEWKQSVMVGADGSVYGTDFQYDDDGNIKVGSKTLSPEVSSAIQEAAEISGIPVDMQLAIYGAESSHDPSATSKKGAGGLGQLTAPAIEDVIKNYPEELEAAGIPLSVDMDRLDPRTNAIVSSLYMKLQNDEYLNGRDSIEERYIAYNIGANNPFIKDEKFINADPNTPIDKIGFPTTSESVKNNIDVYRKPNGQWRTKNEVYEEIRNRMGIVNAAPDPNESVATLERKAADKTAAENAKTPSQLPESEKIKSPADVNSERLAELANIDFQLRPDAFANAADVIAKSIIPDPGVLGGESVSNLDVTFYEEALEKAGVPTDSKTVARVHEAFSKDPELNKLGSEDVAVVISFAEKGMWGSGLDMAGLRTNIKTILQNRENNRKEYRQFVDDSRVLSDVAGKIKNEVHSFNENASKARERLAGYNYDISRTSDPNKLARLSRLRNTLYEDMDRNKTLHEQKLQGWHKDALERATKIEAMNQHLRQVFNQGISNQAEEDIKKLEKSNEPYRNPEGRLASRPTNSRWNWEANSPVW